jgi:N-acetylmuramoyl-L-alanine amidase
MRTVELASPNFDSRDGHAIDMLVLHYTGMASGEAAIRRLCDPTSKVSAHYVVEEDGTVNGLVNEENRAWHAGVSSWRGHTNINQRSIGIEIVNPGHEFGYRSFPEKQMESVTLLCQNILSRHKIPARNVIGHSDIAPARKQDPGELFNWQRLAQSGIGVWPQKCAAGMDADYLAQYGYDLSNRASAITAFQRHFRPNPLNGLWDEECARLLAGLITFL